MKVIDSFTHFASRRYLNELASVQDSEKREAGLWLQSVSERNPQFFDIEKRIEDLKRYNIDAAVTTMQSSVDPNSFPAETEEDEEEMMELSRFANDDLSHTMQESEGRILALGTVPLPLIEKGGLEEMRRAWHDLGLKGFMVLTNIRGKPVDQFPLFWEEAAKLGSPVWIHPANPASSVGREYEDEFDLLHVFGWPYETTLILSRLVLSGTMKKHPELRIIAHHLGGMVPFYAGRIAESYDGGVSRRPDQVKMLERADSSASTPMSSAFEFFKQFYYDTAVGGSEAAVRLGIQVFGSSRIVFATDYPWGRNGGRERLANYPHMIRRLGLAKEQLQEIFEENIQRVILDNNT